MDDLIDSLESTTLAPETDEGIERTQTKQGRNAKKKQRMKLEASLGPLAKALPKPRPTRAPDKKKRKPTRSQEAKARRFGRSLRRWIIKLPPQNGFVMTVPATTLDLFDSHQRVPTSAVTSSLKGWSPDSTTYIEAPSEGVFLIGRNASDLEDFDDDPDDLGASTAGPHQHSHSTKVSDEGIFLPQGASPCEACESLCNLPPTKLPPPAWFEPEFALIRFELHLPLKDEQRLNQAISTMRGVLRGSERCRRSSTSSWHVGPWSKYRHVPRMTVTVFRQSPEAKTALNEFARLVTELAIKPIAALLKELDPPYYRLATRVNIYVQLACRDNDPLTPDLMWAPLFNVCAFRWGVGEFWHLDNDPKGLYALLLTAERFEGGRFCLPHLKLAIPFGPFTVILVLAAKLVHFADKFKGSRFIFTGFVDYNTAIQAGIHCKEFLDLSDEEFVVWIKQRIEVQWAKENAMEEKRSMKKAV